MILSTEIMALFVVTATIFGLLWNLYKHCKTGIQRCKSFLMEPLFLYTIFWTTFLAAVVTVASISPELAFSSSLSPFTEFSLACEQDNDGVNYHRNNFRVPLDKPGDVFCLPTQMFKRSGIDFVIPPIFAAVVVAASACFVHAVGLWEI
eukprot:Gb_04438 [translate_table: standard]